MRLINLLISLFSIIKTKALECVSVVNQECMARPKIIDVNKNELVFYPLNIKINKCSGNCNNINDSMAKLCMPDIVKDMNIKVNMLARTNKMRKRSSNCRKYRSKWWTDLSNGFMYFTKSI